MAATRKGEQECVLGRAGLEMPIEDSYMGATARRCGLTIVTGNDQDFGGLA